MSKFDSLKKAQASENAHIHRKVAHVSPMKEWKGATFFKAQISDRESEMRLVGFSRSHRKLLREFEDNSNSVVLENWQT